MSGLRRNYTELRDLIGNLVYLPFVYLSKEQQEVTSCNLVAIFSGISLGLEKENLKETTLYNYVQTLEISGKGSFDEQKFAQNLKPFLDGLKTNDEGRSYKAIYPVAEKFLDRVQPLYASELQAVKYRDLHTSEEIYNHDKEIVSKTMQLYALDYFLFAYKKLEISPEAKKMIISGIEKMPALAADALADDMLKKVVYSLYGKNIRKRMIEEYYTYKKAFLPAFNEVTLTDEKVSEIKDALCVYCLSLIDISLEYGVATLKNSLLQAYGSNADLLEIKKQISNVTR